MTRSSPSVLMTADTVGGVWSFALALCSALPDIRFILATLGPRPQPAQRAAVARLDNVILEESDFCLEWMAGGEADMPASRCWLEMLASRHAIDLVHVNGYAQARLDCGRPVVAVAHSDVLSWWRAVHGTKAPGEWSRYRRQVIGGLRAADRVVAPTHAVGHDLRRHYGQPLWNTLIIPNGVAPGAFGACRKQPVIMAAGRVWDAAKNLHLLDDIAPGFSWPIEIAGAADHPEAGLARLQHARQLGLLSPEEIRRHLGEAAIFTAPARYEPFGLGILEAAACSCALVLGDIASLRENWQGAAIFLPTEDAGQWRVVLSRLIDDDGERERLAAAARARAGQFTMARTAQRYRALYHEMTGAANHAESARRVV